MPYKTYSSRRTSRPSAHSNHSQFRSGGRSQSRGGPKKMYINPAKFVQAAQPVEENTYVAVNKFEEFDIEPMLKKNILAKGFTTPSPIQDQTIPLGLAGRDVVGVANTGTGKTAAFAIPLLNRLMNDQNSRALIVAPTRELAQQIDEDCRSIARGSGLNGAILIGGAGMGPQLRDLKRNPRIVIGTPGRIKDHLERRTLNLTSFNMVVLDEVDRMLDMGFINDVREILSHLAQKRQSFFFSATLDPKVNGLIQGFSNDPVTITLKSRATSENVHQDVVQYGSVHEKIEKLHDLLIKGEVSRAIVFDDTQRSVERLSKELILRGFKADAIHGGKTQGQRQRALSSFKKGDINILVATDVAARGIDVADVSHVINYSTPQSYDDYVHRIGRAGRAGKIGHALTFIPRNG